MAYPTSNVAAYYSPSNEFGNAINTTSATANINTNQPTIATPLTNGNTINMMCQTYLSIIRSNHEQTSEFSKCKQVDTKLMNTQICL